MKRSQSEILNEFLASKDSYRFLGNVQDHVRSTPCSHNCKGESVGRCETCKCYMCKKCLQDHNSYKGFRDHIVFTIQAVSYPKTTPLMTTKRSQCTKHPTKNLKFYCETCEELICRKCIESDHSLSPCECKRLEEVAEKKRERLETNQELLESELENKNKEMESLIQFSETLEQNLKKARRVINERKDSLLASVQRRVERKSESLMEEARTIFEAKKQMVDEEIERVRDAVEGVKVSSDMVENLLWTEDVEERILSYQSLNMNIKRDANTKYRREKAKIFDNNEVLPWSFKEIDMLLLREIKGIEASKTENTSTSPSMPHSRASLEKENSVADYFEEQEEMYNGLERLPISQWDFY